MPCFFTLAPCSSPLAPGRDDEGGMPTRAQLAIDAGDHDVDVGDPAVGRPGLLAVEDPLVGGLVVARRSADRGDVGPGVRLRGAEGGNLRLLGRPVALRHPLDELVGRPGGVDPGHCQRRAHDREADSGVAPEQLLVGDRKLQPGRVGPELGQRLEAIEADLGGLLDDRPGRLLALVPLGGCRTNHLLGEPVNPVADLPLVLAQLEAERGGVVLLVAVDAAATACSALAAASFGLAASMALLVAARRPGLAFDAIRYTN